MCVGQIQTVRLGTEFGCVQIGTGADEPDLSLPLLKLPIRMAEYCLYCFSEES